MPTFHVYSRSDIQRLSPPFGTPHIFISISTPGDDGAKIETNEYTLGILRLWFYDFDTPFYDHVQERMIEESELFNVKQAEQILEFVNKHPTAGRIIVHCDMGWSRSPAVAAALSKIMTNDDMIFFKRYDPNMRVYRTLINTHFGTSR